MLPAFLTYIFSYFFFWVFREHEAHLFSSQQVGDFGLSRLKYETYLTTKTGKGTVL